MKRVAVVAATLLSCSTATAAEQRELGDVNWSRDYAASLKRARAEKKPLLILFDEVPGCATCVRYGEAVLRHPLIVDAAENEFVPVTVFNNLGGKDAQILKKYGEPSWNNPVVRIVGADERDLVPRHAGDYSRAGLVKKMIASLEKADRPVPQYLSILAAELGARRTKTAVFSMYCFWSGEACLGRVDGVVASRTGFLHGAEVVEITYDPSRVSYERLVSAAKAGGCAKRVFARSDEERKIAANAFGSNVKVTSKPVSGSQKDDKYQLRHTAWRFVPMTPLQATLANSMVGARQDPASVFSPRQREILAKAKKSPGDDLMFEDDLIEAFASAR